MSCDITLQVRTNTRKRCTVYTHRRLQQIAISCKRTYYNKFKKHELYQFLSHCHHEELEEEDGCHLFGSLIGVSSVHSCPTCSVWDTNFFDISHIPQRIGGRSGLPVPICPLRCTSPRSRQFWVASHDILDLVGNDREFHHNSFWYISSGFAVPSTVGSLLCDDAVRNWESIQSPLTKILTGFAFNQEMSNCTFGIVSHNSNNSTLPISRIIAFESSLNGLLTLFCCESAWSASWWGWLWIFFTSSRTRKLSACFTTMWQSRHSEVDFYALALCEQTDGLLTLHRSHRAYLICVHVFVCVFVFI